MHDQSFRLRELLLPFVLTAAIIVADQITKAVILTFVEPIETTGHVINVIGDFLRIIRTQNVGVAFSLGQRLSDSVRRILFIVLPLSVLTGLVVYYFRTREFTAFQRWAIAGIVGGGLGNQIDRIFRSAGVVDWIDIKFYGILGMQRFPTFNVADSSITVCSILLLVSVFVQERHKVTTPQSEESHE